MSPGWVRGRPAAARRHRADRPRRSGVAPRCRVGRSHCARSTRQGAAAPDPTPAADARGWWLLRYGVRWPWWGCRCPCGGARWPPAAASTAACVARAAAAGASTTREWFRVWRWLRDRSFACAAVLPGDAAAAAAWNIVAGASRGAFGACGRRRSIRPTLCFRRLAEGTGGMPADASNGTPAPRGPEADRGTSG